MLEHGGRLRAAVLRWGLAREQWLDLSTGISPWSWLAERAAPISLDAWQRLPEDDDGLAEAAAAYYGVAVLPVAGSQAAIQALPRLRKPGRVGMLTGCYAEHALCWQRAGHVVIALDAEAIDTAVDSLDVLLLVHPDNPSGVVHERRRLLDWQARLAARGGWLIVDEAFIDATPALSLADETPRAGLIVLRSLGKFFGLAGARVGFALAEAALREALAEQLGPWAIAGPARQIAMLALQDRDWQAQQRKRLHEASARLHGLMADAGLPADGGCALFQRYRGEQAAALHEALAERGILTRLHSEPAPSLRLGLPATEADWQRLAEAFAGRVATRRSDGCAITTGRFDGRAKAMATMAARDPPDDRITS
ncbi:MAG: threonine-phosphate decarboxylase [Xanthomonadaceae bacterium]|nr:threonine-phosphate decarboxylase [Xanthomonadaceae bacterium]